MVFNEGTAPYGALKTLNVVGYKQTAPTGQTNHLLQYIST